MVTQDVKDQNKALDMAFGLLVALLNIVEMYILIARVKKRKNYENILLSLSVADLLFGLSNAIVDAVFLAKADKKVLNVFFFTFYFFVTTSILHLTLINIDRLWTVFKPIKHKVYFTRKRVKQALGVVWAIGIGISIVLLLTNELTDNFKTITRNVRQRNATIAAVPDSTTGSSLVNSTRRLLRVRRNRTVIITTIDIEKDMDNFGSEMKSAVGILILVADVGFIVCNTAIVYLLSRHSKNKIQTNSLSSRNSERKVSIICVVVTLTFVLFTMPFALFKLFTNRVPIWTNILLVINSGMNSIVYFFRARIEKFFVQFFKDGDEPTSSSSGLQNSSTPLGSQVSTPMPLMKTAKK